MKVEVKDGKLIITLDLQAPTPSATGKTMVVASSQGNQPTTATIDGKPVIVGVNACVTRQEENPPGRKSAAPDPPCGRRMSP